MSFTLVLIPSDPARPPATISGYSSAEEAKAAGQSVLVECWGTDDTTSDRPAVPLSHTQLPAWRSFTVVPGPASARTPDSSTPEAGAPEGIAGLVSLPDFELGNHMAVRAQDFAGGYGGDNPEFLRQCFAMMGEAGERLKKRALAVSGVLRDDEVILFGEDADKRGGKA